MRTKRLKNERKRPVSVLKKNMSGWVMILPSLLLFVLIVWRPVGMAFYYAFFRMQGFQTIRFVGLQNFKDVLTDTAFLQTMLMAGISTFSLVSTSCTTPSRVA